MRWIHLAVFLGNICLNSFIMSLSSIGDAHRSRIQGLVDARIKCRSERDYIGADVILKQLKEEGVLVHDISYKEGGGCEGACR